jgi:hypothetical protein
MLSHCLLYSTVSDKKNQLPIVLRITWQWWVIFLAAFKICSFSVFYYDESECRCFCLELIGGFLFACFRFCTGMVFLVLVLFVWGFFCDRFFSVAQANLELAILLPLPPKCVITGVYHHSWSLLTFLRGGLIYFLFLYTENCWRGKKGKEEK